MLPLIVLSLSSFANSVLAAPSADACSTIGTQIWNNPQDVRACFKSFALGDNVKTNVLDVVEKTLPFHASVNYQKLAPLPYSVDVHEDIVLDVARIRRSNYQSEYDFHIDLLRSAKRAQDGHFGYINYCYDGLFTSYLPIPLVVLKPDNALQGIYIAPEAATVINSSFPDQVPTWEAAIGTTLAELSGSRVLAINGKDPWISVDQNAAIAGSYQQFGTRQIGFFASYSLSAAGAWSYSLGQFAQQSLPLADSVTITVQNQKSGKVQTYTVPYRSKRNVAAFDSTQGWRSANCVATESTNGIDYYAATERSGASPKRPSIQKRLEDKIVEDAPKAVDIALPATLTPSTGAATVATSGPIKAYQLSDKITGVIMLGSFSASDYDKFQADILNSLQALKDQGVNRLIIDVTNNGGGFICVAHWFHRLLAGPKSTTSPQAGLNTTVRAGALAQKIVDNIIAYGDPQDALNYNPINWAFPNGTAFNSSFNYLQNPNQKIINGRRDAFSLTLDDQCQPFDLTPPPAALFDSKKVIIINNGRCASSCALFTIAMIKEEGAIPYVYGGRTGIPQSYAGTVGGQSLDYQTIASELKSTKLGSDPDAPPDFITNSYLGITWRLGYGIYQSSQIEEWQSRPAKAFDLKPDTVNNPAAIWDYVRKNLF